MAEYKFRRITREDYALFKRWLVSPHIDGWWADAQTEIALIEEEFDNPAIDMNIVELDGTPFAFIQDYDAHAYHMPQYSDVPQGARAIDTFLGDATYLNAGHGSGYIAQRIKALRGKFPQVVTDPDPKNERAIRAYTRAGFRKKRITIGEDGDLVQVMVHP